MRRAPTTLISSLVFAGLLVFGLAMPASAQVDNNPPGVARISMTQGDVSMQRGDSGDTSAVTLNTPLVAGDKIFTGPRARAELQLDWADILRLDENSQMNIASLEGNRIQVQFSQGLGSFSVLKGSEAQVEIDTPNVAIIPHGEGRYRIEVTASGDTLVSVREGEVDVSTPEGSTPLRRGQMINVRGMGNDVQFQVAGAPSNDDFDRWNSDRDHIITNAESWHRTNQYYTGAADLDAYGRWDNVPDYGNVWVPRVAVGWTPYRQGRWLWEPYWGWTWVSYEPWGWAPYHYGRWFVHSGSWVWWPGPVTRFYRPVYAPAYVSFFGFGRGVNVGVSFGGGFGSIGWLPVGPCDFVSPWWGSHRGSFNVVNITNVTNIYNVRNGNVIAPLRGGDRDSNIRNMMINNQVRYGVSTVAADHFGRGNGNIRPVSATELREGKFVAGNVPVAPSRESVRVSDRPANVAPARLQNQEHFFSKRMPSNQHESFTEQSAQVQQAIEHNPNFRAPERNAGAANTTAGPANTPGAAAVQGSPNRGLENRPNGNGNAGGFGRNNQNESDRPANSVESFRGNQTPNQPAAQGQAPQVSTPAIRNQPSGGWRRFGQGQGGAAADVQTNQRAPVVRAPRQAASSPDTAQPRAESQGTANPNRGQPFADQSRTESQRAPVQPPAPSNIQRTNPVQNDNPGPVRRFGTEGNVNSAPQSAPPSAPQAAPQSSGGGWQRFSEQRPSDQARGNFYRQGGNAGNSSPSPRSDSRPALELNRPIIQQRSYSAPERPAANPGPARVEPPAQRSAPATSAPRSEGFRPSAPAASGNSGGGFGGHGGASSSQSRAHESQRAGRPNR